MARSIKKEKTKKSLRFWIILSVAAVAAVVGLVVGILVGYTNANTAKIENKFAEYTSLKLNGNELDDVLDDEIYTKTIVIAYNSSFRTDFSEADDKTSYDYENYKKANEYIATLNSLVIEANKKVEENKIALYLMNTELTGNGSINGEKYGSLSSPAVFFFALEDGDETNTLKNTVKYTANGQEVTYKVTDGGEIVKFNEAIKNCMEYIKKVYSL